MKYWGKESRLMCVPQVSIILYKRFSSRQLQSVHVNSRHTDGVRKRFCSLLHTYRSVILSRVSCTNDIILINTSLGKDRRCKVFSSEAYLHIPIWHPMTESTSYSCVYIVVLSQLFVTRASTRAGSPYLSLLITWRFYVISLKIRLRKWHNLCDNCRQLEKQNYRLNGNH